MTTYRLMDGAAGRPGSGPSLTGYSGPWLAGTCFSVTGGVLWFEGFWWWVPAGGDTGAQKFALWNVTGSGPASTLVPGTTVTSGTLTAGAWNFVALGTPVQLAPGTQYVAATGWTAVNGVPITGQQFGSVAPATYQGGIVNGPLAAWSDSSNGGTNNYPGSYAMPQGLFSDTLGADPSVHMPNQGSNSSNFWVDVQVSDTAPAGYAGSWQLFPNMGDAEGSMDDLGKKYTLGLWFTLSEPCTLDAVRYFSPPGAAGLATEIAVWDPGTREIISGTHNTSPSWSGAAGSGWVQAGYGTAPLLAAGDYVLTIFSDVAQVFNATTLDYYTTGFGASGLTAGPVTVPDAASASLGQNTYEDTTGTTGAIAFPDLYVAGQGQNYWLDAVFTPAVSFSGTGQAAVSLAVSATGSSARAGTGAAALALAVSSSGTVPAAAVQTGSWWGLDTVLKQSREEFETFTSRPPMACPECGQPLVNAPSTKSGSGVELYCEYAGDHRFHYPEDWQPPVRLDSGAREVPW